MSILNTRTNKKYIVVELDKGLYAYTKEFLKALKKIDKSILSKLFKKIEQIFTNPGVGKHMCANRSGQQEVYIADAFRLYYSFNEKENLIEFLEFSHKKHQ